jgi:hypothetical protein
MTDNFYKTASSGNIKGHAIPRLGEDIELLYDRWETGII